MKITELKKIEKLYFGYNEIARVFGISLESAKVAVSRYVKQGLLLRLKRNMYVLPEVWRSAGREEKFLLANVVQVPSYISLTTALDYHEATTQVTRDYFESIAVKRTKEIHMDGDIFRYTRLCSELYFGFR